MTESECNGNDKIHDKGYRDIFANKTAFLHVLKKYINKSWAENITPDDIEQVNTSFVLPDFKDLDSDLIFKMERNGEEVYFYVLLELQSKVDHTMPFRLLMYMASLLNYVFKNTPEDVRKRKDFRLPAVVPIVLYNGEDNWTAVRSFREYTKNGELFGDSIIDFAYHLLDIRRTDKQKILTDRKFPDQILAFDKSRFEKVDVAEMEKMLIEDVPNMTDEELAATSGWLSRSIFIGVDPEKIKDTFLQIVKKGELNPMVHPATVFMKRYVKEERREEAVAIARKLLERGDKVDDVVAITGLDLNDVLKLKGEV